MRRPLRFGTAPLSVAAFVVVLVSATASISFATPTASGPCTKSTARQLIAEHDLNGFRLPDPVLQLLCGPFTGPASQAMAVVIGPLPTCWPSQEWVVFSLTGGEWKLVLDRSQFIQPPLVAVGGFFRILDAAQKPQQAAIVRERPAEGMKLLLVDNDDCFIHTLANYARQTGAEVVTYRAGFPLEMIGKIAPNLILISPGPGRPADFGVPGVTCWSLKPEHRVSMNVNGKLNICRAGCTADFGESPRPQLLAYGKQITVGRFRCYSLRAGIKCVVIRSGKGFVINRDGVRKVG